MAVVKAPALSMDASGNLGGICYSSWRGLSIARDPWTGTVPNTTKQVEIQDMMTTVSQAWSEVLSSLQRQLWVESAQKEVRLSRVKTSYIPTGYQYFVQLNMQRLRRFENIIEEPPIKIIPYGFDILHLSIHIASGQIRFRNSGEWIVGVAGFKMDYWVAGPYDGGGRRALPQEYKFYEFGDLTINVRYTPTVAGKWYWVHGRWHEESGRVGNWYEDQIQAPV